MKMRLIFGIWIALATAGQAEGAPWRGIIPLQSSRADVQRALPPSTLPASHASFHKLDGEVVLILYASGPPCGSSLTNSWRVAEGIVLSISVSPLRPISFSSLGLDPAKHRRVTSPNAAGDYYLVNDDDGVRYHFQEQDASDGVLIETLYYPRRADNAKACEGHISKPRGVQDYPTFQTYGNVSLDHERSFLDNFAAYLLNEAINHRAFIISFSDGETSRKQATARAIRAKNYLVKVRGVPSSRVTTQYGGKAQQFEVKLYALSRGQVPKRAKR